MTDDCPSGETASVVPDAQVSDSMKSMSQDTEKEGSASSSGSPNADADDVSSDSQYDEDDNDGDIKGKSVATPANPGPWQAIYSPQHNSYYFYNTETQETTWTNPLTPSDSTSASTSTPTEPTDAAHNVDATDALDPQYAALQQAAIAQGIDPGLAYLDPTLASTSTSGAVPGPFAFTAKFNARTGQFTRPDGRDPTHLSEYERMKRMSEFYFDVGAWEQQLSGQGGSIKGDEESKKRKRPSKKDLERFKEQKRLKKIAKTAWLRT